MTENLEKRIKMECPTIPAKDQFYTTAKKYWERIPATVNGMLGGFGHISSTDVQGSKKFLNLFLTDKKRPVGRHRALDCGSGIGRVSKHLLLQLFDFVDLVEQNKKYLDESIEYIGDDNQRVEQRMCLDLQNFTPKTCHYDVIWCQWVLSHLHDDDVILFLKRCIGGLRENGIIVIKDNVSSTGQVEVDEDDSTLSRPLSLWQEIVGHVGISLVKKQKQQRLPKEIYEVWMFALRPETLEDSL